MTTVREQLATTLREARLSAGFDSQGKLATKLHVSRAVINKAESANQSWPSDPLLASWAEATGANLAQLLQLAQRQERHTRVVHELLGSGAAGNVPEAVGACSPARTSPN